MTALRRNILLFHQGALGDFVVSWPLALGLGRVFAQSRVFYVTSGQKGALAERAIKTEFVDVEGGWHQLFSDDPRLPPAAERLLVGARQVISFVSGPDDQWARNVRRLAPEAALTTLSTIPPDDFGGHVTEHLLAQLKPFPVMEAAMQQMLRSVAARGVGYPRNPGAATVLHPGAGSDKKCWPADQFLELARRLRDAGLRVEVVLGEVELEKWPAALVHSFSEATDVVRPATLVDLLGCLAGARAFVGNDSGPGHVAGIIGVPTFSIFGPKSSGRWRPLGPQATVLAGEWDEITPSTVADAIIAPGQ